MNILHNKIILKERWILLQMPCNNTYQIVTTFKASLLCRNVNLLTLVSQGQRFTLIILYIIQFSCVYVSATESLLFPCPERINPVKCCGEWLYWFTQRRITRRGGSSMYITSRVRQRVLVFCLKLWRGRAPCCGGVVGGNCNRLFFCHYIAEAP